MSSRDESRIAAHSLLGRELPEGWHVVEKVRRPSDATGSRFSVGYIVQRDGTRAFLKALDYSFAFGSGDAARVLEAMTSAYNFEVDVLERCAASRMDRIVTVLGHGEVVVEGADGVPNVSYLLFELAEGDVRHALDSLGPVFDYAWAFRTLHHAATGLWQLHGQGIAHQDLKPSNVLTFGRTSSKLADLGRASRRGVGAPHEGLDLAGDPAYAPPELLYGQIDSDWSKRRQCCDTYLLGSLTIFMFSGATATAAILTYLDDNLHPGAWGDSYAAVLPYVRVAFDRAIVEFEDSLSKPVATRLVPIAQQLCDPDPELRGHPVSRSQRGNSYSLERYVAEFDLLARRAEIGYFKDVA